MSGNKHLIDKFTISEEAKALAHRLFNTAKLNTGEGSGHAVGGFATGLPAACVLMAVERLNTTEVDYKAAQAASCLDSKDFKRVYESTKAAVERAEKANCITYHDLYKKYNLEVFAEFLDPWITRTEDELLTLRYDDQTMRCAVYFWVCNIIKPKALPDTAIFSRSHGLSFKSFVALLEHLNQQESAMRKNIQTAFKAVFKSSRKGGGTPQAVQTPSKSPFVSSKTPSNDISKTMVPDGADTAEQESPTRRSSRISATAALLQAITPSSPRKSQIERSPTKVTQPTPLRLPPGRKAPIRELPSKDTPKKRPVEDSESTDKMDVDQAPPKKRRTESVFPPITIAPLSITPSRPTTISLSRKKAQTILLNSLPEPPQSSPSKANTVPDDAPTTSEDESEEDEPIVRRRFRPIYLEHKQWYSRDPRLERMWKKACIKPSHA